MSPLFSSRVGLIDGNLVELLDANEVCCSGRPGRLGALKEFVDYISKKEGVWVATRTEIAEAFKKEYPYKRGQLA